MRGMQIIDLFIVLFASFSHFFFSISFVERAEILNQIHLKRNQDTPQLVREKVHLQNFIIMMSFILRGQLVICLLKIIVITMVGVRKARR